MAGLTSTGLEIKRYTEILDELNTNLKTNLGVNLDTSVNSVVGVQNGTLALQLAKLWELALSVYDSGDLLKAEGEQLDNLALLQGILRLPALATRGIAWFTGDEGTQITSQSFISSLAGDVFYPEESFTITSTNTVKTTATLEVLQPSTIYQIVVDSVSYTYTSTPTDTLTDIRNQLIISLGSGSSTFTATAVDNTSILFTPLDTTAPLNISASSYITFSDTTSPAYIIAQELGFISGDAHAITIIQSPVNGWGAVDNPDDLSLGRNEETDDELRNRVLTAQATIGASTFDSIAQRVSSLSNVESVLLYENDTWQTDDTLSPPLPPKSYTVTVHGGDEDEIADTIWKSKPTGIQTIGNMSREVTDLFGQTHTVYFSRPTTLYTWIKVEYSKYSEEEFPVDGEEQIKQACLIYGDSLEINNDIIPQRFIGEIFQKVQGIDSLVVRIAITTDDTIDDPNNPLLIYETTRIPIAPNQVTQFGTSRMVTTEI